MSQQNHLVFASQFPTTLSWNSNKDQGQFNYRFRNAHRTVKLPDILIRKCHGDPLKWNEWSNIFTSTIHNNPDIINTEWMSYLQPFVIGPDMEYISGFPCNPNFYSDALNEINRHFGNPQNVVSEITQELEAWQRPQANVHRAPISNAALLRIIVQTFLAYGFNADLSATYLLKLARDKLPNSLKMKWSEHTIDNNIQNPGLLEFSNGWTDTLAPVNNCRKPVHKTTTTTMDFKETFEETILRFLTAHKGINSHLTGTATPTINIDPMIEEISKSHFGQAITSAENKILKINNLDFQGITTRMQGKTHQTPKKLSNRNASLINKSIM